MYIIIQATKYMEKIYMCKHSSWLAVREPNLPLNTKKYRSNFLICCFQRWIE